MQAAFHSRAIIALAVAMLLGPSGFVSAAASRQDISLDRAWNFVTDPSGSLKIADLTQLTNARQAVVPGSWQSQFSDLREYAGVGWYWTTFELGEHTSGQASEQVVLLHCGAVDYLTDVYINGRKLAAHEGGYLPFSVDITSALVPGSNQVALRVVDPGKIAEVEGIKFAEIPHGKQGWYVETSGPWQGIELQIRPATYLGTVHAQGDAQGRFQIEAIVRNPAATSMKAEILSPSGDSAWRGAAEIKSSQDRYLFSGQVSGASLWSPDHPALYTLRIQLDSGDVGEYTFGFRTFEAREGRFFLNGSPIYLRGALDQAFYVDSIYTPPSLGFLKAEMGAAKHMGLNLLRCHIKVPDPRYLDAADQTGILVWYEIPSWDKLTADSKRRAAETLRGMVERDWNHPSIVILSVINVSGGADLKEAGDRQWLKQSYQEARKSVPGWLVDDNSACCENFHLATDIADFHNYNSIPDHADDFDRFVTDFATRPGWLFSPYGDAEPKGTEPLVLSEFGNWGLPQFTSRPWWFDQGFGFATEDFTSPHGVEERFTDYHYASLFKDLKELAAASAKHEFESLKFEIEALRLRSEIQGYVITEFTDVNWEANGLLDMYRAPKLDVRRFAALQQDDLVVVKPARHNYQAGEKVRAEVDFSHFSSQSLSGAAASWALSDSSLRGDLILPAMSQGSVAKIGTIEFEVPDISAPTHRTLKVSVTTRNKVISENSVDLFFYPPEHPELPPTVEFDDPSGKLRRLVTEMRRRGYQAPSGSEAFPVLIASSFDEMVKQRLKSGGRVILLATESQVLAPGLEIKPRAGSNLSGDWISDFAWHRADREPFKGIGFGIFAGFETEAVTPPAVIVGIPPEHFDDVLSGVFYGWLRSNAGTLVQAAYGRGRLLICTFGIGTSYGSDPYASSLLDSLVIYAVSGCSPSYTIPAAEK